MVWRVLLGERGGVREVERGHELYSFIANTA